MTVINVKGYRFSAPRITSTYNRRAQQFKNAIFASFRSIGIGEDDVIVELERVAFKNAAASASWYIDGHHLHYSYKSCSKYVENLYVVSQVIALEVQSLIEERKTVDQFILDFAEEEDLEEQRKAAREHIGVHHDSVDLDEITKKYKLLAKKTHPDMPEGSVEAFKKLNHAHKILKRELG